MSETPFAQGGHKWSASQSRQQWPFVNVSPRDTKRRDVSEYIVLRNPSSPHFYRIRSSNPYTDMRYTLSAETCMYEHRLLLRQFLFLPSIPFLPLVCSALEIDGCHGGVKRVATTLLILHFFSFFFSSSVVVTFPPLCFLFRLFLSGFSFSDYFIPHRRGSRTTA